MAPFPLHWLLLAMSPLLVLFNPSPSSTTTPGRHHNAMCSRETEAYRVGTHMRAPKILQCTHLCGRSRQGCADHPRQALFPQ